MRCRHLPPLLLLAALGLGAAPAAAQPAGKGAPAGKQQAPSGPKPLAETLTGEAKEAYDAGKLALTNKEWDKALLKFERAYELSKDPRLLFNIAICHKQKGRYARMLTVLRQILADPSPLLTDDDRKAATDAAAAAENFVSTARITVNEPGAAIFVDDEPAGTSPIEPLLVDEGKRRIRVTKPGFRDFTQEVKVMGAAGVDVAVKLERDLHQGRLVVVAGPNDTIAIDGKAVGRGRYEGTLPSRGYALRVTGEGKLPYQSDVLVQDNQVRRVDVTLTPKPTEEVASWLWIAGGAVLMTGAIIGGVVLFQPADRSVPGSIDPPGTFQLRFGGAR